MHGELRGQSSITGTWDWCILSKWIPTQIDMGRGFLVCFCYFECFIF